MPIEKPPYLPGEHVSQHLRELGQVPQTSEDVYGFIRWEADWAREKFGDKPETNPITPAALQSVEAFEQRLDFTIAYLLQRARQAVDADEEKLCRGYLGMAEVIAFRSGGLYAPGQSSALSDFYDPEFQFADIGFPDITAPEPILISGVYHAILISQERDPIQKEKRKQDFLETCDGIYLPIAYKRAEQALLDEEHDLTSDAVVDYSKLLLRMVQTAQQSRVAFQSELAFSRAHSLESAHKSASRKTHPNRAELLSWYIFQASLEQIQNNPAGIKIASRCISELANERLFMPDITFESADNFREYISDQINLDLKPLSTLALNLMLLNSHRFNHSPQLNSGQIKKLQKEIMRVYSLISQCHYLSPGGTLVNTIPNNAISYS